MAFDPNHFIRPPNVWYQEKVMFRGRGRAEFTNPACVVDGRATVRVDEFGHQRVELKVSRSEPPGAFSVHVPDFQIGTLPLADDWNPCARLTVVGRNGTFSATDKLHVSSNCYRLGGGEHRLSFRLLRSQFEAQPSTTARYWVLPLLNLVSPALSRPTGSPEFAKHPLRIFPTPDLPADLADEDRMSATMLANLKNCLIGIKLPAGLAFIEALPDYQKRKTSLETGRKQCAMTAVMVGDLDGISINLDEPATWFPLDVLNFLSLATGVRVGAPWIEFRNSNGELVRRLHMTFGSAPYRRGHAAMPEEIYPNTGYLLTKALASPEVSQWYVRVVMTHLLNAGIRRGSLEDRFVSLCRALETLCRRFSVQSQDLSQSLDAAQKGQVSATLTAAVQQIQAMQQAENDATKKRALGLIADRARNANNRESRFGDAVIALLNKLAMSDAAIVRSHFALDPNGWEERLSMYRGAAIHEGAFDLLSGKHDLHEIDRIANHLHDLLTRIVLKTVGYDADYGTPLPPIPRLKHLDWVRSNTPSAQLGYV